MNRVAKTSVDEAGATLILALIFIVICSLLLLSLVTFTGNDLLNTGNLRNERTLEFSAASATNASIEATRYTDNAYTSTTNQDCMPNGVTSMTILPSMAAAVPDDVVTVVCGNGTTSSLSSQYRTVNLYACQGAVTAASCSTSGSSKPILTAQVQYDDYSSSGYDNFECSSTTIATCGTGMTIESWVVSNANS